MTADAEKRAALLSELDRLSGPAPARAGLYAGATLGQLEASVASARAVIAEFGADMFAARMSDIKPVIER